MRVWGDEAMRDSTPKAAPLNPPLPHSLTPSCPTPFFLFKTAGTDDSAGLMKKVFPLQQPGWVDARVVEAVKNDVRKYVQRERRKELPEGATRWGFACAVGAEREAATPCTLPEITGRIDDVVRGGGTQVYIEIVAQPESGGRTTGDGGVTAED